MRNLAKRNSATQEYNLVVATHPEAMRGVDYRSPVIGITLLVGKSFANSREADQGLKRVGRLKDPYSRITIERIPLVDPLQEGLYKTELLAFCRKTGKENI